MAFIEGNHLELECDNLPEARYFWIPERTSHSRLVRATQRRSCFSRVIRGRNNILNLSRIACGKSLR